MIKEVDSRVKPINMAEDLLVPALSRGHENAYALICNNQKVTYGEINSLSNRAGNVFKSLEVNAGDRVLMMVRDTPNFFYIYLGLLKIGAIPIGLNTRLAPNDIAYIIDDSGSKLFILEFNSKFRFAIILNSFSITFFSLSIEFFSLRN